LAKVNLGVQPPSKRTCRLYFLAMKVILTITYSLFTLDILLYLALIRPKLEYASTVENSIKRNDPRKLERVQRKFVDLCQ
jgi:hypothetical protein